MQAEPRLTPLPIRSYHPKTTEKAFSDWNESLALVQKRRAELSAATEALRESVTADDGAPEKIPAKVQELYGRRLALDVAELKLALGKGEFKKMHLDARAAERDKLLKAEKSRREEIISALKKAGITTTFEPGVVNSDEQVRSLAAARSAVSSFENVVVEADEARVAFLLQRIAAAVPTI